jgi:hypothetical protein
MVAPEVLEARVTTTALFWAAVVEIAGATACVVAPPELVAPPPPPQPTKRTMLAQSAYRKPDLIESAIQLLLWFERPPVIPSMEGREQD